MVSARWKVIAPVCLLGAVSGIVYVLPSHKDGVRRPPATASGQVDEVLELRKQLARLEEANASNAAQVASLEARVRHGESPAASAPPAKASDAVPEGVHPGAHPTEAEHVALMDHVVKTEGRDPTWARGYEESLRESIVRAANGEAPSVEDLSCATSVCRLTVRFKTPDSQRAFVGKFPSGAPPNAMTHWQNETRDGVPVTTIHVVRAGYPIPGFESAG